MQQVQDKLLFPIDTPSDKEMMELHSDYGKQMERDFMRSSTPSSPATRNQRKRRRQAQKKARWATA